MNRYYITSATGSTCSTCGAVILMLANLEVTGPAFYVCFPCKYIGQIGVGPVKPLPGESDESQSQ